MAHADPHHAHRREGSGPIACWVLTISDTRTTATDKSGDVIRDALAQAGHTVLGSTIVKDDADAIRGAVEDAVASDARALITTGGTGLTARDSTYEVLSAMIQRPIPGFGELFRMLSYEEIQSAAMLSRAVAGVIDGTVVFALPGSSKGVRLGMDKLIIPELGHVLQQLDRDR